jgi:hypothetical protein
MGQTGMEAKMAQEILGGGTNARPLNDTVAETGPGLPDEAIGPEQRTLFEQTELADSQAARDMEAKLRADTRQAPPTDDGAALDGV